MNVTWSKSFGKVCFWVYVKLKFLKSLISHVSVKSLRGWQTKFKVSVDLKISCVSRFQFWAIEPNEKTEMMESCQFGWMLSYFIAVCFLKLLVMFFVWKSFFRLVLYYFSAFLVFLAFLSNWPGCSVVL